MPEGATITNLPDEILDFLSETDAVKFARTFVKTYSLSDDQVPGVMNLAEDVVYSGVPVAQLPNEIVKRFSLDQTKAKQAAFELAEARLLPIESFVGDVRGPMKTWGGDLAALPESKDLSIKPEVFVHNLVMTLPGKIPLVLQHRLEHFLTLYVTSHSDRTQVLEMLMRDEKVGGMEFEKEDAERLLAFVDEKKKGKRIEKDRESVGKEKKETPVAAGPVPVQDVKNPVTIIPPVRDEEKDKQEIEKIKAEKRAVFEKPSGPVSVELLILQVCTSSPLQFNDPKLLDRCKQIVESRLREVRSASDTQRQFERPFETGGLGVSGRKLADMMQVIEQAFDRWQKYSVEKVVQEKEKYKERQSSIATEQQSMGEKEERVMTKRYVELTGKMPSGHILPVAPSVARVSAAMSASETLKMREQKIDPEKVKQVVEAAKVTGGREGSQNGRPVVMDVKFARRLSGPIDELRSMTLVDFRRLSKDARTSAERIKDQVGLVEEEGFERRVEAVRAWQSSPLHQMYLAIARRALQEGKPLEAVRQEQEKIAGSGITKEELAVLLI
jgi:hypothetical protein